MRKKTVLVTGASRGIGKSIALRFAKDGYDIIINCAHREDELLQTKKEVEKSSVSCLAYVGDLGNYEIAKELFSLANSHCDGIDVLINNAGVSYNGLFTEMAPKDWNTILNSNLMSVIHCCSFAAPTMISKKHGKIINISSVWGSVGASCEVIYSASKGGINSFTKALAKELAPSNIQVNAVACGAIDTEMNQFLNKEEKDMLIEEIPANRFGRPEEVAEFVFQLANGNNYLNGQVIHFDGAWI